MSTPASPRGALLGKPQGLRDPLIEEYNKLVRAFREGRWEPAELSGGKLCEIVYTILRGHVDGTFATSPSKPKNMVAACQALEQATAFPRSIRIQIPRMLISLYEIRNNRNVGHVGGDVDPNHMDAAVVFGMVRWIVAELVRVFHSTSVAEAAEIVEGLTDRTVPLLWQANGATRVLNPKLTARERTLVLLYGTLGALTSRQIASDIEYANVTQFRSKVLKPAHKDKLIDFDQKTDRVVLSPLGSRYVEQHIPLTI